MDDAWNEPSPPPDPQSDPRPPRESPVWPLAIAGGVALLLGLVFFAWHVLEQGWVEASHKVILGGVASVLLTAAAWPLAKRGQPEVAGALGGAGLGAWFSTWLVARHVYAFVSAGQAFVALVVAVVVCLVLADRLRLRLMAALAAMAACATPALTSTGGGALAELMIYQLGVLTAFAVLDVRRNWPELPSLGLLGTWSLLMGWGANNLDASTSMAFAASAGVLVVAGAASTWRIGLQATEVQEHERGQAVARVAVGGVAAWCTAGWAFFEHLPALRTATLLLAAWHLGFSMLIARRDDTLHRVTLGMGWMMACAAGVLFGGMLAMVGWWTMMAIGIGLAWSGRTRYLALVVPPAVLAGGYALVFSAQPWALAAGMLTALLLVVVGLWPARETAPRNTLVLLGLGLHVGIVLLAGPEALELRYALGLVPLALVVVRGALAPKDGFALANTLLLLTVLGTAVLFEGIVPMGPALVAVAGLAAAGFVLLVRARPQAGASNEYETLGLVTAGFVALLALGGLGLALPHRPAVTTVVLTATGLGLVAAGLRFDHKLWRYVGLSGIGIGAAKLALIDTANAALVVRGVSFIAVGAILILGAYVYRRAARRDDGLTC